MVHMYFRVFARNVSKRYAENQKFLNFRYDSTVKCEQEKDALHREAVQVFQMSYVQAGGQSSRGHGKICITCPKCREQFVRRS